MPGPTKAFRAGTSREELTKLLVKGGGGEQQKEGSFFFLLRKYKRFLELERRKRLGTGS
jgi:hypothetical protein